VITTAQIRAILIGAVALLVLATSASAMFHARRG